MVYAGGFASEDLRECDHDFPREGFEGLEGRPGLCEQFPCEQNLFEAALIDCGYLRLAGEERRFTGREGAHGEGSGSRVSTGIRALSLQSGSGVPLYEPLNRPEEKRRCVAGRGDGRASRSEESAVWKPDPGIAGERGAVEPGRVLKIWCLLVEHART